LQPDAVRRLFAQLMAVNPSVEVYLLDTDGRIIGHDAPPGRLRRDHVDLAPVRHLLAGNMLPIFGDDPRSLDGRKVFSAAPLHVGDHDVGYIYVVLLGEAHDKVAATDDTDAVLRTTLWSLSLVAGLCLIAGLVSFSLITRPLRRLTGTMRNFDIDAAPNMSPLASHATPDKATRDEIAVLDTSFHQMSDRLGEQWRALRHQDQERRELFANLSHDLRTPLSSLHGYLEALTLKDDTLTPEERQRYLSITLDQSANVGKLVQKLFEFARIEHGFVEPMPESFLIQDLVQDVFAKLALAAEKKAVTLKATFAEALSAAYADVGLSERVLTNLLDNAIKFTPMGGNIEIDVEQVQTQLRITVSDTGPGIPDNLRGILFERPVALGGERREGGLGLRIVRRILQVQGSDITLIERPGYGAVFQFTLDTVHRL
jgi:signal transduction histidine kinase